MNTLPFQYGHGGTPPVPTPSGSSILDRGYPNRQLPPVIQKMPTSVPQTGYNWPGPTPATVGPQSAQPPGPNPLQAPTGVFPSTVGGTKVIPGYQ